MRQVLVSLCIIAALTLAIRPGAGDPHESWELGAVEADARELEQADELPDSMDGILAMLADEGEPCWREAQHRWSVFVARVAEDSAMLNSTGDALAEVVGACDPE